VLSEIIVGIDTFPEASQPVSSILFCVGVVACPVALVFVYDFHPTAQTLYQLHVASSDPNQQPLVQLQQLQSHHTQHSTRYGRRHRDRDQRVRNGGSNTLANGSGGGSSDISGAGGLLGLVDERILWSILVQIANAMKDVHERGLAMRTLDVSKVIVTGKNR
jgi:hypothetical protein